jgi:hypothetical protein|tara:strand:+ start:2147 stop:2419 length:273 start_codon:yes stop_codon:yes gene_type:complete
MSKVKELEKEVVETTSTQTETTSTQTETTQNNTTQEEITPIFEEVEGMNPGAAVEVLIQAGQMAQASGALTVRDSIMLGKAIATLRPGTI